MVILIPILALALCLLQPGAADCGSVTCYTDGSIVEQEAAASKGVLELPLPAAMIEGSLRVRPLGGTVIQRVEFPAATSGPAGGDRGVNALLEQKSRLEDRMKALATREEIFKTAAKSQSGKAPRRTKANPDPMQSIRQGTDFAIAQLEAVYTARRKTEQEIRRIDERIAAAKAGSGGAGTVVRIHLSPVRGRVAVRYAVSGTGWTPRYDLHLDDSHTARLHLSGLFSGAIAGYLLQVSPTVLDGHGTAPVYPVPAGSSPRVATYRLAVSDERFGTGIRSSFSFVVKNPEQVYLPGGEASLYRNGEYIGRFRFEGISSGRSRTVSAGL